MGSINALETARRNGATVLFASSGDIYGGAGQQPFVEKDIFAGRITPYAESKRAADTKKVLEKNRKIEEQFN